MHSKLARIGYLGPHEGHHLHNSLSCHFEVHIEQGRRLQDAQKRAGIVTGIQGIRWYRVHVEGEQGHAGSTPMDGRADAFIAVARVQLLMDELARQHGAVATVGVIQPGRRASANTIPGSADFTMDIRCPSEAKIVMIVATLEKEMRRLEAENSKLAFRLEQVWHSPAADFDTEMLDCLRSAASRLVGIEGSMDMMSFAGHDSALTALQIPTAMLFVPCKDGVSHAPEEWSTPEQW